jgi:ubiquinone biosynthesis protein
VTLLTGPLVTFCFWLALGLAAMVLTTAVSLRLLGIRRGWARAVLAGCIGWTIGLLLGLAVADWDWGTDGLALHVLAFSIPATMAVAVAFDLLAQPGSLATGERAGLVVAPRPFRALRLKVSVILR